MLPTNEKSKLVLSFKEKSFNHLVDPKLTLIEQANYQLSNIQSQHLYILSDEEIKEGDWCIMLDSFGNVFSQPQQYNDSKTQHLNKGLRKIISTTDKSLICKQDRFLKGYKSELPLIHESFITYFINQYNLGNIITDIMVEYSYTINKSMGHFHQYRENFLKINSDNTIHIKPFISESEVIGKKIIEYCKQYEGTDKYNDVLKAIEFGYQLGADKNL